MTTWLGEEYSRLLRAGQPDAGFNSRPDLFFEVIYGSGPVCESEARDNGASA